MLHQMRLTVVIPTLNEEKGIAQTLAQIPQWVDEVIVVDGDSKDQTAEIARGLGAKVVIEKRRGYGRAFKTGFAHASGDLIATIDGDGTYPIDQLEGVIEFLKERDLDFVSCSRFPLKDPNSMRKRNWVGNWLMTQAASVLWFEAFDDILSGMWVFRRESLKRLPLLSDSWNFSEEIKIQAFSKLGPRFAEYHIPYRERLGETKLVPWKVGLQNVFYLLALRTGSARVLKSWFKPESLEA